ncbi:hypothetical protein HG536_0C02560 [Torulaspora globosa]|uniref:Uncharacterized protein n=1 Tax=Torulaspora globosa TaxID=48254 RepID=A0A7G3ZF01_9SACH|nr:uncharacterized protein HG536_0C02560 [Torulaspora globosa]QLL32087.1 hypothetical protein HG536_0C02560 [Torulaspora globosa]
MILETIWKVKEALKVVILLFFGTFLIQWLINAVVSQILSRTQCPVQDFSVNFFGTSVRNLKISTSSFKLKVGKITFKFGKKGIITFSDVEILLLHNSLPNDSRSSSTQTFGGELLGSDHLKVLVSRRILWFLRWIFPLYCYLHSVLVSLPDGSLIKMDLGSMAITKLFNNELRAEIFMHAITNVTDGDSVHHIGYQLKGQLSQRSLKESGKVEFVLRNWSSYFRASGLHVHISDVLRHSQRSEVAKDRKDTSCGGSIQHFEKTLQHTLAKYRALLRSLKIFDMKIENLTLSFDHFIHIKISSAQIYLECVNIFSYGVNLEFFPSNKLMLKDHEFSISANSVVVYVNDESAVRIPLINNVLTTDILSLLLEGLPLARAKVAHNMNIINPSVVASIEQLLQGLAFIRDWQKMVQTDRLDESRSFNPNLPMFLHNAIDLLPSFIFQLIMANFSTTLKLSNDESLTFKVYNIHAFLYRKNKSVGWPSVLNYNEASLRPELSFIERDPFSEQLSNYIKVVGTSLVFLKLPSSHEEAVQSIPIFGFERCDTFLNESVDPKIGIHSTLRHCALSLDNLDVIKKLHSAISSIVSIFQEDQGRQVSSTGRRPKAHKESEKPGVGWSAKLRLKDLSCSLLAAGYLSSALDPKAADPEKNLTNVPRGMILVLHESFITATPDECVFKIVTADLVRMMDNENGESVSDNILTLRKLEVSISGCETRIQLPNLRLSLDVNLIWLVFFLRSVLLRYFSFIHLNPVNDAKSSEEIRSHLTVGIDSMFVDIKLPQSTPLFLLLSDIRYKSDEKLCFAAISAFVQSVYVKQLPVQVCLLKIKLLEFDVHELNLTKSVRLKAASMRLHTEYHFSIYMVLDNLITMIKAFKQIRLAFSHLNTFRRLYPSEQQAVSLPTINLAIDEVLVNVEEDPFEQELGLILKVGVLEQRERIEKLREFEDQKSKFREIPDRTVFPFSRRSVSPVVNQTNTDPFEKAYQELLENFSTSWIARYRKAKLAFHGMPYHIIKQRHLGKEHYFYSAQKTSAVGTLVIKNLNITLKPPSFQLTDYAAFIHKYGKGVPKDRAYTLLIPMGIDVRTDLWELRLRDYPIPAVSFPNTHTTGDVVFGEKMPEDVSLRTVYCPFVPSASEERSREANSIYGSHIIRTLNSIKTFFKIETTVASSTPASITWGKSLQPGYSSLMLWFDYLTRPQDDPSRKLGFWDKFRYLVHGKWTYRFSPNSEFHLNIKGSHNPYKIADDGAGLSFCWSNGTVIQIHGSEDPKEFLKIESKKFQLAVRDFTASNKFDKILMKLEGHVIWKLGLLFEQGDIHKAGQQERSAPSRPHYDIKLVNPKFVSDIRNHDSYSGFRSDFIHMSIGVYSSAKNSANNLYLAPYTISHFLKWWNLFHTYTSGPIRQGPLFTDLVQNATKFGRSLFTIKYQLHLEPLTFTHVYRHYTDLSDSSNISFTGLKGKVGSLRMDLHQKRVKLTHTDEKLNKSKPVWKFKMSSGEIDCSESDVRILSTSFDQSDVEEMVALRLGIQHRSNDAMPISLADISQLKESEWYDFEDYVDLDQVSLKSSLPLKLEALPLLYSPRISYFRKINDDGYVVPNPFGDEESHNCMIGKNHPERTQERLARQRAVEIEEDIKKVKEVIGEMKSAGGTSGAVNNEISGRLHNLKYRLHIVHSILGDLKLSENVPSIYSFDGCESSLPNEDVESSELESLETRPSLFRAKTIQSFRSMRRASTLQEDSTYDNRFIVHNIQFKINKLIRHHLLEYASSSFERKSMQFFLTHKSIAILRELLNTTLADAKTSLDEYETLKNDDLLFSSEFANQFDKLIRQVPSDDFDFVDSYLIRLISPQLQFMSDVEPDTAVILAARDIEMGIIDIQQVIGKSGKRVPMDVNTIVETRYCAVSKDIQLFTLYKEDILSAGGYGFQRNGYGAHEGFHLWPPWLPLEICYDGSLLEKDIFLRRRSMVLMYTAPNPLFFSDKEIPGFHHDARFRIGFPGLIITSTSQQYCSVYNITRDLLSLSSSFDEKVEKLAKVLLADEVRNNLEKLDATVVTDLQRRVKELYYTREFLKVHDNVLFRQTEQELTFEIQATMLELSILMTAIKKNYDRMVSGGKSTQRKVHWQVGTGELIWELYDDNKKPFITIGLGPSNFVRSQAADGSNSNIVAISSLQCFNQQESPVYLELLSPYESHSLYNPKLPMIEIFWNLGPPVGGISELKEMVVSLQPIVFKMDHLTSGKIMNYLFPKQEKPEASTRGHGTLPKQPAIALGLNSSSMSRSESNSSINSGKSLSEGLDSWDLTSVQSTGATTIKKRKPNLTTSILNQPDENINEMVKRSGTYFNVKSVLIKKAVMSVCYKGAHHVLTDVNNLIVRVPNLEYHQKLWSRDELFAALRRDITKVVVQHLGHIIGNKLVPHKKENKLKASMDISNLLKWESSGSNSATNSLHKIRSSYSLISAAGSRTIASSSDEADEDVQPFFPQPDGQ